MAKLFDRAGMSVTGAPGTGVITLNAGLPDSVNGDLLSFANAGVASGDVLNYLVVDGNSWEIGNGTYSSTSGTGSTPGLTRTTVVKTWNGTATGSTALTLTTAAKVYCVPANSLANTWGAAQTITDAGSVQLTLAGASSQPAAIVSTSQFRSGSVYIGVNTGDVQQSVGFGNGAGNYGTAAGLNFIAGSTGSLCFTSGNVLNAPDLYLRRDAAAVLALRNGASNPQTFRVYGDGTDATTQYARLSIKHAGGTAGATIATEASGTGTAGALLLQGSTQGVDNAGRFASYRPTSDYNGQFNFAVYANGNVTTTPDKTFQFFNNTGAGVQVRVGATAAFDFFGGGGLATLYGYGFNTVAGSGVDTALWRNAAGVVEINNGTANTYRDLKLRTLLAQASTTTAPNINFATGVAPTTPNNGDLWFDGTALKIQVAGATQTIGGATSSADPSLANCAFGGI